MFVNIFYGIFKIFLNSDNKTINIAINLSSNPNIYRTLAAIYYGSVA